MMKPEMTKNRSTPAFQGKACEGMKTVPALAASHHQLALDQLGDVAAGGLWCDTRRVRQLTRRDEAAAHQRGQHAGAGGVADHRGDLGKAGLRGSHSTERRTR